MRERLRSVFWQLIILLAVALLALLLILLFVFHQNESNRLRAEKEYFHLQVQDRIEYFDRRLQEMKMIAARLTENDLMQDFLEETDRLKRWQYSRYVEALLDILISDNSHILSMDIFWPDGTRYTPTDTELPVSRSVIQKYEEACADGNATVVRLQSIANGKNSWFVYIAPMYSLESGKVVASLALYCSCEQLIGNAGDGIEVFISDSVGNEWPSAFPENPDAEFGLSHGLRVGFVQTRAFVDTETNRYEVTVFTVVGLIAITLVMTGVLLVTRLTHPVMSMSRQMESVRRGSRRSLQITGGSSELTSLCRAINDMLATLEENSRERMQVQDQLYQADVARMEAQLYALRNQINPHFLYNTLQTVRGIAIYNDIPEIGTIVTNMAHIFRYTVCEEPLAQVHEEMTVARRYIAIMNARHTGKYVLTENIGAGLERALVPRMMVQPMIENSVKYAFDEVDSDARIDICWRRVGEDMELEVSDNGAGMEQEALEALIRRMNEPFSLERAREADGIGLHNIHQRLFLRYGASYGVRVESRPGEGVRLVLRMPVRINPEDGDAER